MWPVLWGAPRTTWWRLFTFRYWRTRECQAPPNAFFFLSDHLILPFFKHSLLTPQNLDLMYPWSTHLIFAILSCSAMPPHHIDLCSSLICWINLALPYDLWPLWGFLSLGHVWHIPDRGLQHVPVNEHEGPSNFQDVSSLRIAMSLFFISRLEAAIWKLSIHLNEKCYHLVRVA